MLVGASIKPSTCSESVNSFQKYTVRDMNVYAPTGLLSVLRVGPHIFSLGKKNVTVCTITFSVVLSCFCAHFLPKRAACSYCLVKEKQYILHWIPYPVGTSYQHSQHKQDGKVSYQCLASCLRYWDRQQHSKALLCDASGDGTLSQELSGELLHSHVLCQQH